MNIFRSHLIPIMMLIPILSAFGYTAVTIYNQEYRQETTTTAPCTQDMIPMNYPFSCQQEQVVHQNNVQEPKEEK